MERLVIIRPILQQHLQNPTTGYWIIMWSFPGCIPMVHHTSVQGPCRGCPPPRAKSSITLWQETPATVPQTITSLLRKQTQAKLLCVHFSSQHLNTISESWFSECDFRLSYITRNGPNSAHGYIKDYKSLEVLQTCEWSLVAWSYTLLTKVSKGLSKERNMKNFKKETWRNLK